MVSCFFASRSCFKHKIHVHIHIHTHVHIHIHVRVRVVSLCWCLCLCVCVLRVYVCCVCRRNPGGASILTCKSFDTLGEGGERQNGTISQLVPSNDSLRITGA